jgi:predicted kinase
MTAKMVIFAGPALAGKTTLAREFARRRAYVFLSGDDVRKRLFSLPEQTEERRDASYNAMHFAAGLVASLGHDVVIEATYIRTSRRQALASVIRECGATPFLVECSINVETALERLEHRGPEHPGIDLIEARVRELVHTYSFSNLGVFIRTESLSVKQCVDIVEREFDRRALDLRLWTHED